jgi:hypothetical protein
MMTFLRFCSRVSVRRVTCALQTPQHRASHSEAATIIPGGKERTR